MSVEISITIFPKFKSLLPLSSVKQSVPSKKKRIGRALRGVKQSIPSMEKKIKCRLRGNAHEIKKKQGSLYQEKNEFQNDNLPLIKWLHHEHSYEDGDSEVTFQHLKVNEMNEGVEIIKLMLRSMSDGEITVSPYDTAWVALVKDINGEPKFPESLKWIANNQLEDGSWGDDQMFSAHDRILNTLACVTALMTWSIHSQKCCKGMKFIRENLSKIGEDEDEHMPIGFEIVFPSLIEIAKGLGIQLHDDSGVLQHIYAQRDIKLQRIPKDILHSKPTSLLHSLEGMEVLEWEKLMKLQSKDGSFLFSPASTAFGLIQTKDLNCSKYLENIVSKFNGGAPNVYPVDLFEHIWVVDRLQRLGISRLFMDEIKECMEYVFRNWSEDGICWARNSEVQDIDDTAMGFRLLRLHGYNVSPGVFKNFKKNGEFFCFAGQSTQAVTGMFNLFRASQVQFPGEEILEEARHYSSNYLSQKQASNQLLDKWIIMKDLPGEVGYALNLPWYANLPRIETRFYIEQYGGSDDVWIGKTLYRMPYVSNNIYLELAKLDFKTTQALHLQEFDSIKRWYGHNNLKEYDISPNRLLQLYFVAAASIPEPVRSHQRLAWAKTATLVEALESYCRKQKDPSAQRRVLAQELYSYSEREGLVGIVKSTMRKVSMDVLLAHNVDIGDTLHQAWEEWMDMWVEAGDSSAVGEAKLLTRTIQACFPTTVNFMHQEEQEYQQLMNITSKICQQLRRLRLDHHFSTQEGEMGRGWTIPNEVNEEMQRLAEMVFSNKLKAYVLDEKLKLSFWEVARSYYYMTFCSSTTINTHLYKVMFDTIV